MSNIINAKIRSTMLGIEDHGIMSFFVFIEWPGAGVGFGGYGLDVAEKGDYKIRVGSGKAYQAIRHILETVGVTKWEDLPGKYIRIVEPRAGGRLDVIGNIVEDKWFNILEHMEQAKESQPNEPQTESQVDCRPSLLRR